MLFGSVLRWRKRDELPKGALCVPYSTLVRVFGSPPISETTTFKMQVKQRLALGIPNKQLILPREAADSQTFPLQSLLQRKSCVTWRPCNARTAWVRQTRSSSQRVSLHSGSYWVVMSGGPPLWCLYFLGHMDRDCLYGTTPLTVTATEPELVLEKTENIKQ